MHAWAAMSSGERETSELMQMSKALIAGKDDFSHKAIPHLCDYLPTEADLNVTVRLTAFVPPNAFAWEDVIISVSSKYWKGKVVNIWNLLVHELFHAGYSYCQEVGNQNEIGDEIINRMLRNLHSEGVCTYVGYKALPLFPAPDIEDYQLLERPDEIERSLKDVNMAFSKTSEDKKALQQFVWERCVQGRAYYVVGAYMCKMIASKAGKASLITTLLQGPVSFVKLYNTLVEEGMKVQVGL